MVTLHSSDPASVHLAIAARTVGGGAPVEAVDDALYNKRTLVLVMGMRRTLWVVPSEAVPVVVAACGREGRIMRMRPRGGWTSTQHRYGVASAIEEPMEEADAQAELARRWLSTFGKASADLVGDLKWWTGWTLAVTKRALAEAGDSVSPTQPAVTSEPWVALVPSLDATTMGWKDRSWYLDYGLRPRLFDNNGNAGPAIWMSGRIVGGWTQRPTGEVVTRLLVDIGRDGAAVVEAEAARTNSWLDTSGAVVKPRFPTPLQRELST